MTFKTLLHHIRQLIVRWLVSHLDDANDTPNNIFTFNPSDDPNFIATFDEPFEEEAFEAFNDLPPPPHLPQKPETTTGQIILTVPRGMKLSHLENLHAAAIIDPPFAETMRWQLLNTLNVQQTSAAETPIQAWLDYTRRISNDPTITLATLHERDLSERAKSWIRFLVGINIEP